MKNKILFFLCVFSVGVIFTYPTFVSSHSLDSYCTIYNGYSQTAFWFLQNGRIFSALIFYIFSLINLPFSSLSFVSSFLTSLALALAVCKLYYIFNDKLKLNTKIKKLTLLISIFLIFYNFLSIELIVIDESFIIYLGFYFLILCADKINIGGMKNYLLSLLYMIISVSCYQGISCFLFPILILMIILNKESNTKEIIKKILISFIIYGLSFVFTLIIIKLVSLISKKTISKLGNINIISNIVTIFKDLLPQTFKTFYGFINNKYYYLICIILLGFILYQIIKDKEYKKLILLTILILSCTLSPYIPNLFMNSSSNYTAARMTMTCAIVPSVLVIYALTYYNKNKYYTYFIFIIICLFGLFTFYLFRQNSMINLKRYKEDMIYINKVKSYIDYYNAKHKEKIKTVYYAKDTNSNYYYDFGNANGVNIRLMAVDWSVQCAFSAYLGKEYKFIPMKKEDYNKYFKDKDYKEFNEKKQIVVDKNNMYLLIY